MSKPVDNQTHCPKEMSYIPAGSFRMGSNNNEAEQPIHTVETSAYCIDKYEVTNSQFRAFEENSSRPIPDSFNIRIPDGFDKPNQPAIFVSWSAADAYCKAQGKRLPTEAEWERAARGPKGYEYGTSTGLLVKSLAHYLAKATAEVGSYPSNGYDLYDMTGNVWEWVADWYGPYSSEKQKDPKGPVDGKSRVRRGGAWYPVLNPFLNTASVRWGVHPESHYDYVGFRCVSAPQDSKK